MTAIRVVCPACQRVVRGRVPRDGDGSAYRPYRHAAAEYEGNVTCEGSYMLVDKAVE